MSRGPRHALADDLFLPTLLFTSLGGMTWAVRGCSGFGAVAGCVFAGVTWGTAWWYLSQSGGGDPKRRYDSGWVVLALTAGIGLSGARGWMQWPNFFDGKLVTNAAKGEFVPIARVYGFVWLFVAGVPWAGLGACLLAWCGPRKETRAWHWAARMACGLGGGAAARYLFDHSPHLFLPLYNSIEASYRDLGANPTLRRVINDCGAAVTHLGYYLGFLLYEALRRDRKNVALITTVGLINGLGWSLCQCWKWAPKVWAGSDFNFWRCWESSGGISIGLAFGIAFFLVNREATGRERDGLAARPSIEGPNPEWLLIYLCLSGLFYWFLRHELGGWGGWYLCVVMAFGVAYVAGRWERSSGKSAADRDLTLQSWGFSLGLFTGLGLSVRSGLKGWCNLYLGHEEFWSGELWAVLGPIYLAGLIGIAFRTLTRPAGKADTPRPFSRAYGLIWLVLITQNVVAQLVTGPHDRWSESAFCVYYFLLFLISAMVVFHVRVVRDRPGTGV